jgi:hypothetical protein
LFTHCNEPTAFSKKSKHGSMKEVTHWHSKGQTHHLAANVDTFYNVVPKTQSV